MIISLIVSPIGTSARPAFLILPASANTLVPFDFSLPIAANASPPFTIIQATLAYVSTLLIFVGFCQYPFCAGKGGFSLGIPLSPSSEAISAVSSPQTNAPAPALILISKSYPDSKMFLPRKPFSLACSIAISSRLIASGYSARQYMIPSVAPIAKPPIIIPSRTECGSPSRTALSMNAPGSPSSALHTMYFSSAALFLAAFHLNHVGKPAPPRPLSPETLIISITSSAVIDVTTFLVASYPPTEM